MRTRNVCREEQTKTLVSETSQHLVTVKLFEVAIQAIRTDARLCEAKLIEARLLR